MAKFIELKEAAEQLGITQERLLEMKEAGDIHGYRDGASWKFKAEELERVKDEMATVLPDSVDLGDSGSAPASDLDLAELLDVSDSGEMDGGSDILIDETDESEKGTAIGDDKEDGDLKLADEDDLIAALDSDLNLAEEADEDSDFSLSDDAALGDDDLDFDSDDDLQLEHKELEPDEGAVKVGEDEDSGSDIVLVGKEESDDLLLGDDLALSDDDMIPLDELTDSADDSTPLQPDEAFLLSPSDDTFGDDSSEGDSGSQVIALDDSGTFEGESDVVELDEDQPLLVPDDSGGLELVEKVEPFGGPVEEGVPVPLSGEEPEAPYSAWNLLALVIVVMLLSVTGMLMADIVRNMWAWNGDPVSGGMAEAIIDALGMK